MHIIREAKEAGRPRKTLKKASYATLPLTHIASEFSCGGFIPRMNTCQHSHTGVPPDRKAVGNILFLR